MIKTILISLTMVLTTALVAEPNPYENLPRSSGDFYYAQQTSLAIFVKVPTAVLQEQFGETLEALRFDLAHFDDPTTGTVVLKPMAFTAEFGAQGVAAPGLSSSSEFEVSVLVRPKNTPEPNFQTLLQLIRGETTSDALGQLRVDVLCDDEIAVAAGRVRFGEHKYLASFTYQYETANSNLTETKPFKLRMSIYTWQGAERADRKILELNVNLAGIEAQKIRLPKEVLYSAFPAEPGVGVVQKPATNRRYYAQEFSAYTELSGASEHFAMTFGEAEGAEPLKPAAPFGDGQPIAGSEKWPKESVERFKALLTRSEVVGYLLYQPVPVEYESAPQYLKH